MTSSSQPQNYSNISIDDTLIDLSGLTITSPIDSISINTIDTITITGSSGVYNTVTNNYEYQFNWSDAQEWVDAFPDWQRVQDMCKKYPGLEIALRNFQTVYTLVKDDYDNPKDEN
jgi:hypothetical protein